MFWPSWAIFKEPQFVEYRLFKSTYCIKTDMDSMESFIYPTDAQLDCSKKMLKFTLTLKTLN